jgi:hypothetical protein
MDKKQIEMAKRSAKYASVTLELDNGTEISGKVNFGGFERISDFFDHKFSHGGSINVVESNSKQMVSSSKVFQGFNAIKVVSWRPINEYLKK